MRRLEAALAQQGGAPPARPVLAVPAPPALRRAAAAGADEPRPPVELDGRRDDPAPRRARASPPSIPRSTAAVASSPAAETSSRIEALATSLSGAVQDFSDRVTSMSSFVALAPGGRAHRRGAGASGGGGGGGGAADGGDGAARVGRTHREQPGGHARRGDGRAGDRRRGGAVARGEAPEGALRIAAHLGAKADEVRAVAAPPAARPAAPSVVAVPLAAAAGDEGPTQVSVRELSARWSVENGSVTKPPIVGGPNGVGAAPPQPPPDGGRRAPRVGALRVVARPPAAPPAAPPRAGRADGGGRASPLPDEAVGGAHQVAPAVGVVGAVGGEPGGGDGRRRHSSSSTTVAGGGGLWEEPGPARSRSPRGRSVHRTIG